jgi:hypothetical protein
MATTHKQPKEQKASAVTNKEESPGKKKKDDQRPFDYASTQDQQDLEALQLDSTDEDGDPLNEKSSADDLTGEDLDMPGAELDDADEAIGEEDEENNSYSRADN